MMAGGQVIQTSGAVPNPIEWLYISDAQFDGLSGQMILEELYGSRAGA